MIRQLTPADLSAVVRIAETAAHNTWTLRVFEDCLKAAYVSWVVEHTDHAVIGFIVALCHGGECQIMNIGVDPAYRRQGVGTQLLRQLFGIASAQKVAHVSLEVRASNAAAIALYHAVGFTAVGERKQYYPTASGREDAVILVYSITE